MVRPSPAHPRRRGCSPWWVAALALLAGCHKEEAPEDTATIEVVDKDGDGWAEPQDCDDTSFGLSPSATEVCNGLDDDCDGVTDDNPADGISAWLDYDRDGWGDPAKGGTWCGDAETDSRPWVSNNADCDDGDGATSPSSLETCAREGDDDCDGNGNEPESAGCTRFYGDHDGDGVGSEDYACLCVPEGDYVAEASGDCDDSDATISEGCVLGGTRALLDADVVVFGSDDTRNAGDCIAGVGDVDGDGAGDVLIGGGDRAQAATWWLLRGPFSAAEDLSAPAAVFTGGAFTRYTALSCAGGSDLDGDGAPELLLGGSSNGSRTIMEAYVVDMPLSGEIDLAWADASFSSTSTGSGLGPSALPGDVNGDGVDDLLLGDGANGLAYLLFGPVSGALSPADADAVLGDAGLAGMAVGATGDLDGDGLGDFAVGAPEFQSSAGAALVFLGGDDVGTLGDFDADAMVVGESFSTRLGSSVVGAGDVDADGYGDLIVSGGAPEGFDDGRGAVWVFTGPLASSLSVDDAVAAVEGAKELDNVAVTTRAGDLDGDGRADLLVGAPGVDQAGAAAGAAYVVLAPLSGTILASEADLRIYGDSEGDVAGYSVAGLGDLDGDGVDDFGLGAIGFDLGGDTAGAAFFFFGGAE